MPSRLSVRYRLHAWPLAFTVCISCKHARLFPSPACPCFRIPIRRNSSLRGVGVERRRGLIDSVSLSWKCCCCCFYRGNPTRASRLNLACTTAEATIRPQWVYWLSGSIFCRPSGLQRPSSIVTNVAKVVVSYVRPCYCLFFFLNYRPHFLT